MPGVPINHEDLDANPYILNVANGIVDLKTGQLRGHDPAELCTKQSPVAYDPSVRSQVWEKCLQEWQPDPDMREYLQREAGACLTGKQTETLSVHHGKGANGKTIYFGAQHRVLGEYFVTPHKSLLIAEKHEQHATVLASLFRARMAVASETNAADKLSEHQVKHITGGDEPIRARKMREDEWEFWPSHTLILVTNHRPVIQGTDEAVWRRVRLIPWEVTIPEAKRDPYLNERLAKEGQGILTWMVEGARKFLADGFEPPEKIRVATRTYRSDEDTVTRFIAECLIIEAGASVSTTDARNVHSEWCEEAGIGRGDEASHWLRVTATLKQQGAHSGKLRGVRQWLGVGLAVPDQQLSDVVDRLEHLSDGVDRLDRSSGSSRKTHSHLGKAECPSKPSTSQAWTHQDDQRFSKYRDESNDSLI